MTKLEYELVKGEPGLVIEGSLVSVVEIHSREHGETYQVLVVKTEEKLLGLSVNHGIRTALSERNMMRTGPLPNRTVRVRYVERVPGKRSHHLVWRMEFDLDVG